MKKIIILFLFLLNTQQIITSQRGKPRRQQQQKFVPAPLAVVSAANTYLAQYQDSLSLKAVQKNELLLQTLKKTINFALQSPKLDDHTKTPLKQWPQKLNPTKDNVQELKTIIYRTYFPSHPEELEKEKTAIVELLSKTSEQNNMYGYYQNDKATLESIIITPEKIPEQSVQPQKEPAAAKSQPTAQTQALLVRGKILGEKFNPSATTPPSTKPQKTSQELILLQQNLSSAKKSQLPEEGLRAKKPLSEPSIKKHASVEEEEIPKPPSQASEGPVMPLQASQALEPLPEKDQEIVPQGYSTKEEAIRQPDASPAPIIKQASLAGSPITKEQTPEPARITTTAEVSRITPTQSQIRPEPKTGLTISLRELINAGFQNVISTIGGWLNALQSAIASIFSWR